MSTPSSGLLHPASIGLAPQTPAGSPSIFQRGQSRLHRGLWQTQLCRSAFLDEQDNGDCAGEGHWYVNLISVYMIANNLDTVDMAKDLLEHVVDGPEGDAIWEVYQGNFDNASETDEGDMEAQLLGTAPSGA